MSDASPSPGRTVEPEVKQGAEPQRPGEPSNAVAPESSAGQRAMELFQQGSSDPEAYAEIVRAQPGFRQGMISFLHRYFGNAFVNAVLDAVHRESAQGASRDPQSATAETDADRAVHANIVAAQHELDRILVEMSHGGPPGRTAIAASLDRSARFLLEAEYSSAAASPKSARVLDALESFGAAETRVSDAIFMLEDNVGGPGAMASLREPTLYAALRDPFAQLETREHALRNRYGVRNGIAAKEVSTSGKTTGTGSPQIEALRASLRLAEVEASRGFDMLAAHTGDAEERTAIVRGVVARTHGHLAHAAMMIDSSFDETQRTALRPAIEATSTRILLIKQWIDHRQGNAAMATAFRDVVIMLDGARSRVGLGAVDLDEAKGFPQREDAEAIAEKSQMDGATGRFAEAWDSLYAAMTDGVHQWFELARQGTEKQPSFAEALLSALLTAAAGNVGGFIAKGMFDVAEELAEDLSEFGHVKAALSELVGGVVSDGMQGVVGPAITEAVSRSTGKVDLKALLYVEGGLNELCRGIRTANVTKLHDLVTAGRLSVAQVRGLEACARRSQSKAMTRMKIQSATDWTRYVAQTGMRPTSIDGEATPAGSSVSSEVTDLAGYFGTFNPGGPHIPAHRVGDHTGNAGMLRVDVRMFRDGDFVGNELGKPWIKSLELNGLHGDIAETILSGENVKTLDDVRVPKEVHIEFKTYKGRQDHDFQTLKLAIDETGAVKAMLTEDGAPEQAHLWEAIRRLPITRELLK